MRVNKLSLAIKLALKRFTSEPFRTFELANINQEKGIQIFVDEYATHYETAPIFERLDEILNTRSKKLASAMGVPRELLGERNA